MIPAMVAGLLVSGGSANATFKGGDGNIYIVKDDGASASVQRHEPDGQFIETVVDCMVPDSRIGTSPDGEQLVYVCDADGDREIYLTNLDDGDAVKLTDNVFADDDPAFSVDGARIVFVSNRDGNRELYMVDIGTLVQTRLTDDLGADSAPTWSASNCGYDKIFFVSDRDGDKEIWSLSMDGSAALRQWTNNSVENDDPDVGATGCGLVYSEEVGGVNQIIVRPMTTPDDAPDVRQMTSGPDNSFDPVWNPGRTYFTFSRQSALPASPVRVYQVRYGETDATLIPGQTLGMNYGHAEWAVDQTDGIDHARSMSFGLKKHLIASGSVTVADGYNGCAAGAQVKIQKKKSTGWATVKTATAGAASQGVASFKTKIPDKRGVYRARLSRDDVGGGTKCLAATSASKRHKH